MNIMSVAALVLIAWAGVCGWVHKRGSVANREWNTFVSGCVAILIVALAAVGMMK